MHALKRMSWLVMTVLALLLFFSTFMYLSFRTDVNFLLVKQHLIDHSVWMPVFYLHIITGMLAIAIGPFQFLQRFRDRSMKLHRKLGKTYVAAILLLAAPTGLYMAFYAEGGWLSTLGFVAMSALWFYTTLKALTEAKNGNIAAHKRWMIRSYAVTFSAVTLRLLVPAFSLLLQLDEQFVIVSTAWISWMLNLLVAEGLILYRIQSFTHKSVQV